MKIRNVAIIAHVDHGKTTLVDKLLIQSKIFRENQEVRDCFLDSNDLERERGITILSKNISINYKGYKINIIDTPGHSDFGGEVERVLKMADGAILLVDSFEGAMPQTRFVLQKALSFNLTPILIINKMDKPNRRPAEVLDEVYDLFIDLGADDAQMEFPVLYASSRFGWSSPRPDVECSDLTSLLDTVIASIPAPNTVEGPLQLQVTTVDYSDYVGRIAIGRVFRGKVRPGMPVSVLKRDGFTQKSFIKDVFLFEGLQRIKVTEVSCGDICAVLGPEDIDIGDTIADIDNPESLPVICG
jgi:GTP-binding protein